MLNGRAAAAVHSLSNLHIMSTTAVVQCWRCQDEHAAQAFCPACHVIQVLPADVDYFSVFGLARNPVLDEANLTRMYFDLSRQLHPDLHQTGAAEEQEASLKNTALLNRAYRILRDPVQRGQYWLELNGQQLGTKNNRVPAQLAALVFEVQEKLAELREARNTQADPTLADLKSELEQIRADLDEQMQGFQQKLTTNFAKWEHPDSPQDLLSELKRVLSDMAYLRTLGRDVEREYSVSWNI